jgi:hypothetical protein
MAPLVTAPSIRARVTVSRISAFQSRIVSRKQQSVSRLVPWQLLGIHKTRLLFDAAALTETTLDRDI